ncbi:MAG: hypothetical protein DMF66_18305, partial [Acidobacteria bacterium]
MPRGSRNLSSRPGDVNAMTRAVRLMASSRRQSSSRTAALLEVPSRTVLCPVDWRSACSSKPLI